MKHPHFWTLQIVDDGAGGSVVEGICECGETISEDMVTAAVRLVFTEWPPDVNEPKVNSRHLELDVAALSSEGTGPRACPVGGENQTNQPKQ